MYITGTFIILGIAVIIQGFAIVGLLNRLDEEQKARRDLQKLTVEGFLEVNKAITLLRRLALR